MRTYRRSINYYETDQMGVVHHSNYFRYFEEARVSFMEQAGYPYDRLEKEGIMSPVIAISCKYIRSVRFGDKVDIAVRLTRLSKVKCTFSYEVTDALTGEIRARGSSEHGFIGTDGRPIVVSREKPEFYETFLAELEREEE